MPQPDNETDLSSKSGPTWRFYLACFGGLLLLGIVCVFAYNIGAKKAFEAHIEELVSIGESIRYQDLQPAPVEDPAQNFAEAPIIRHFRGLPLDTTDTQEPDWLHQGSPRVLDIPGYDLAPPNRTRSVRYLRNTPIIEFFPEMTPEKALETVETYCELFAESLAAIHEAARRPSCFFNTDYSQGFALLYPELSELQNFVSLLHLRARMRLLNGQTESGFDDLATILLISDHIGNEPLLIHQLVKVTFLSMAITDFQEGLSSSLWTKHQLLRFHELLADISIEPEYLQAMRMERAFFLSTLLDGGLTDQDLKDVLPPALKNYPFALPRGWIYDNALKYSELYQDTILQNPDGSPARRRIPTGITMEAALADIQSRRVSRFRYSLVLTTLPSFSSVSLRVLRSRVHLDHARLGIQLELQRSEQGGYPDELSAVAAQLKDPIGHDPYTITSYQYELLEDGTYQIYSVGPNRVDEGGLLRKETAEGDWVWRLTLPEDFEEKAYRNRN